MAEPASDLRLVRKFSSQLSLASCACRLWASRRVYRRTRGARHLSRPARRVESTELTRPKKNSTQRGDGLMAVPARQGRLAGRYALVDGIPFKMPVNSEQSPALMAAFSIDLDAARRLIPGSEVHPFQLWKRGLLLVTVIN